MTNTGEQQPSTAPGWLLLQQDGHIATADAAAAALLHIRDPSSLNGRAWTALLHRDEYAARDVEAARVAGRPWRGMLRFAGPGGDPGTLAVDLAPVETPDRLAAMRLAPLPSSARTGAPAPRAESARARAEALEALYEIADPRAAARAVLHAVRDEVPFDWAAVLRFIDGPHDDVSTEVIAVHPANMAGIGPGVRWTPLDPVEAAVFASGEPSIDTDAGYGPAERSPLRRLPAFGLRSRLHLPLFGPRPSPDTGAVAPVAGCVVLYHHQPAAYGPIEGMRAERLVARLGDRLVIENIPAAGSSGPHAEPVGVPPDPPVEYEEPGTSEFPDSEDLGDSPSWSGYGDDDTRFSALGEIVAGVAHELNNPLTAILGYTQLLASLADQEREQAIHTIEEEAQRAARVVRNLLSFARQGSRRAQAVHLDLVVRRVVEVRRYSLEVENIRLSTRLGQVAPVLADESQMEEVCLALIGNAHEVLREQGGGEITVSLAQIGNRVRISVADSGPGVPPDLRRRIFEPFFTARGQGSGMGLAAVYGIIQEHRGQVWVEDSPAGGANFIVELPVAPGAGAPGPAPGGAERVLVVDDEPPIRALTREILGTAGYRVDAAANGIEALRLIETGEYDLVIADLRMPNMGGADLYEEICSRWPHLQSRVIFITGDMDGEVNGQTLPNGQMRYLEKPFSTNSLLRTVRQALDEQPR